ncbi:hypothetical protein MKX03_033942 [Papaver bracteatum]|nr:hypothetical protein MKX03_033942 [Papaver bracteatum]
MDDAELTTENVLKRDVQWESYMTRKMIIPAKLGLVLDEDGAAYVKLFVDILRNNPFQENGTISRYVFKKETVEYVLALIDEMLTANPKRATLFHDESFSSEDTYEPFLS